MVSENLWKVLIVDDEEFIIETTRIDLDLFEFQGRRLDILSASSASEAKEVLMKHQDIAVILLDVIMETNDAGLSLVKFIREELENRAVRIILRTANPGYAPEEEVIEKYDINDYRLKGELTSLKLYTALKTALRSYSDIITIEKQYIQLKKIDKLKSEVLANTSHELKTPINQIKGIIEVLIEDENKRRGGDREALDSLISVYESADLLNGKVNDILESSKIASGDKIYNFEEFDLKGLTGISVLYNQKILERGAKRGKVSISADISPDLEYAYGDQKAIYTVMDNLIRNAVKFTEAGQVSISAKRVERKNVTRVMKEAEDYINRFIMVSVKDTGIGIAEKDHETIFKKFQQVDGSFARAYSGTGLGLYICKNIIEDHCGVIWVESRLGEGATFSFLLPVDHINIERRSFINRREKEDRRKEEIDIKDIEEEKVLTLDEEYKNIRRGSGEVILIVDDDPKNAGFVKKMLDGHGYRAICAHGGIEALKILKDNYQEKGEENARIKLVITDLMMPAVTGYDLCKEIRRRLEFKNLPIIMLTIMEDYKYSVYSFNLGADDYLSKPFDKDLLLSRAGFLISNANVKNKISSIIKMGNMLSSQYEFNSLLKLSIAEIKRFISAEKITILLFKEDPCGPFLRVEVSEGADIVNEEVRSFDSIAGYVWEYKKPVMVRDLKTDERFRDFSPKGKYKTDSCVLAPIMYMEEFFGVICASDKMNKEVFDIDDLNYLSILSDYIAVAINKINDLKKIEDQKEIIRQQQSLKFMVDTVNWVGHEVMSPAQSIMANIDFMIEKEPVELSSEIYKKHLGYIENSCYRIRDICNIVGNYGKKGIKTAPVKIETLIENVIKYAKMNLFDFEKDGAVVKLSSDIKNKETKVFGDMGMLELTLFNMVKNSYRSIDNRMKSDKGMKTGNISIYESIEDNYAKISIEDNGVGIDKEDLNNIFNRNFSTSPDGKGIGLFLAKKVVTEHGGTIEVTSEPNNFTRMDIRLPII